MDIITGIITGIVVVCKCSLIWCCLGCFYYVFIDFKLCVLIGIQSYTRFNVLTGIKKGIQKGILS